MPFFVVDDHEPFRNALTRSLSAFGECALAGSVAEAKGLIESRDTPWTALIIDVSLPDGSGLEVLEYARARGCAAPALVLTVSHDPETINRAFASGARFLVKTGEWAPIESFVRRAISFETRISDIAAHWATLYNLSKTETAILISTANGASRNRVAAERDIQLVTLKRHVMNLLGKTGDDTLLHAVSRLLREAAADS